MNCAVQTDRLAHYRKGFTFVEIMVVIVILGVLSAVGVPKVFGIVEKTREELDVLKLFYLRDALNEALLDDSDALSNSDYITKEKDQAKKSQKYEALSKALKGDQGVTLFVMELKNGVSINVQGSHGSANNSVNMCQLIGSAGTWYEALSRAGFDGVADIVKARLNKTDFNKVDQSKTSYTANKDGNNWRTAPKKPMFVSQSLNHGKDNSNFRLSMNIQWSGKNEGSHSVEVFLLTNGGKWNSAYKGDQGICFSTYGPIGCANTK